MAQRKLPHGWLQVQLGDVVPYGKTQKCVLSDVTEDTWVLELEDVEKESSRILSRKTAKERPFKSTKNRFEKGNVLYGKLRPYLNKVVVADSDGVCTTEIIPLNAEPFVLNRYLFHWLKTRDFLNYVNEVSYGVNMPRLGTKDGIVAPFVLAPLAEQKVIADKLDTLLAQVENTKARLERIPQILKRFRQSVLAAAVSGRLTEEWRRISTDKSEAPSKGKEKFKNDLFDSACESLPAIPTSWLIVPAARVLEYVTSGSRGWSRYYSDNGSLFLRMSNVRYDTTSLDLSDLQYVRLPEKVEGKRSLVEKDDLIVSITADVGRVARINNDLGEAYVNQHLALLRPTSDVDSEYFATCIAAVNVGMKQVSTFKRGATKAGLGLDDIRSLAIPFPSLKEQTEIVRRVDKLFAHANRIEQQVENALARVDKLTQSILAKAFRGELTEQWREDNPELISGENSAEALLERIRAERAAIKPAKKTRNQKATA